jgi:hypothetical protein
MKKEVILKVIATIISLTIFLVILFSSPAEAYNLSLLISENEINRGDFITITASIESLDYSDCLKNIDSIKLLILGPTNEECNFDKDGNIIQGCSKVKDIKFEFIKKNEIYGYECQEGLGQGILKYEIILNSENLAEGNYKTSLIFNSDNKEIEKQGNEFKIKKATTKKCSVRAADGSLIVDEINFGNNNKINFFVPITNANIGEGYLFGQKDRTRINYRFKVINTIKNSPEELLFEVSGYYRIAVNKPILEKAVITVDKLKKQISMSGKTISASYMDINLKEGCNNF